MSTIARTQPKAQKEQSGEGKQRGNEEKNQQMPIIDAIIGEYIGQAT